MTFYHNKDPNWYEYNKSPRAWHYLKHNNKCAGYAVKPEYIEGRLCEVCNKCGRVFRKYPKVEV